MSSALICAAVRQPHPAAPGYVAADLADGLDRVVQGQVRQRGARLGHAQHQVGGARLEQRGGLAHGRVADAHAQPPQPRGGARLVAGTDERPGPGGRGRQAVPGAPGRPAEAVHGAARCLHYRARAADELPGDQERDQDVGQPAELAAPGDQVVLLAAGRAARRVGAGLEHRDIAGVAFLAQPLAGVLEQSFQDPLARLVVHDQVRHAAALRRRVFRAAGRAPGAADPRSGAARRRPGPRTRQGRTGGAPPPPADSCRCPPAEKTTLYEFLSPKMRVSTRPRLGAQRPGGYPSGPGGKGPRPATPAPQMTSSCTSDIRDDN